jgi:hypothetical protein
VKETIYLRVSRKRVEGMTKSLPTLERNEIPVKLLVEVDERAFREPVIERRVHVTDWRDGIDLADIEFRESIITEAEAQMIRDRRLAKMREILEAQGYEVTAPQHPEAAVDA